MTFHIAFHLDSFSLRGTVQATWDYAYFINKLPSYSVSIVRCIREESLWISDQIENLFAENFRVFKYHWPQTSLENALTMVNADAIYILNDSGEDQRFQNLGIPVFSHAVFPTGLIPDFETYRFAVISDWLNKEFYLGQACVIPHIVRPRIHQSSLRNELGIPEVDLVIGCFGGKYNFNIGFVIFVLRFLLPVKSNLWLLTMNHVIPLRHNRFIELPGTGDHNYKQSFINTCDYMLHARADGETFGISCGEFCASGKPVIAWGFAPQRAHLDYFVESRALYWTPFDLFLKLCFLTKPSNLAMAFAYKKANYFRPQEVVKRFCDHYLGVEYSLTSLALIQKTRGKILLLCNYISRRFLVVISRICTLSPRSLSIFHGFSDVE